MNCGAWKGVTLEDVQKLCPAQFLLWREEPQKLEVRDGESLAVVRKRIHKGMQKVFLEEGRDCVIVTHRVPCKPIVLYAMNDPNSHFWGVKFDLLRSA
jgi:broad specificity phosphatase PhoE